MRGARPKSMVRVQRRLLRPPAVNLPKRKEEERLKTQTHTHSSSLSTHESVIIIIINSSHWCLIYFTAPVQVISSSLHGRMKNRERRAALIRFFIADHQSRAAAENTRSILIGEFALHDSGHRKKGQATS